MADGKRLHSVKRFVIVFFSLATAFTVPAQEVKDSTLRKNTVKLDITSYWLYRNAVVFSYERVLKPYQTLGVTLGYQEFPAITSIGSYIATTNEEARRGFKYGAEYRFYLQKDNKFKAPRGVYLGPYLSRLNFKNTRTIEVTVDGTVESAIVNSRVDIVNIGVQLGYQFLINNRWAIDLVFIGPSFSNYRAKFKLDGDFTFDPDDVTSDIIDALIERFPGFSDLITDREFTDSGKISSWGYGYRYQFQVGYHFGRKKKK